MSNSSSILNVNAKKRRKKPSILILDWTDITLDLNPFKRRDLRNKPYKWGFSTKGFFLGMKLMILIDYKTLTPLFFHVYPANVHESRIYPLILELLKRRGLIRFGDSILMRLLRFFVIILCTLSIFRRKSLGRYWLRRKMFCISSENTR